MIKKLNIFSSLLVLDQANNASRQHKQKLELSTCFSPLLGSSDDVSLSGAMATTPQSTQDAQTREQAYIPAAGAATPTRNQVLENTLEMWWSLTNRQKKTTGRGARSYTTGNWQVLICKKKKDEQKDVKRPQLLSPTAGR